MLIATTDAVSCETDRRSVLGRGVEHAIVRRLGEIATHRILAQVAIVL
jgi:hypothetical protein